MTTELIERAKLLSHFDNGSQPMYRLILVAALLIGIESSPTLSQEAERACFGTIESISIFGFGEDTIREVVIALKTKRGNAAFRIGAGSNTAAFSSQANFLTSAHFATTPVTIWYKPVITSQTPEIAGVGAGGEYRVERPCPLLDTKKP